LLGKDEAGALISPAIAQITWVLKDAPGGFEHFYTPFILTVSKALDCIRNLRYSYMVDDNTLFPKEVTRYDKWVIRELLQNCIAHQDYRKNSRIIILEYNDKLIFQNAGGFIPDSVEEVIRMNSPQDYYRNPFLAAAMVNLNMIETVGNGIKKIFTIQRDRLFPLPDYDISDETHTKVTVYGELIDENYTNILYSNPDLSLEDVIALDKIQKKQPVSETKITHLREMKLLTENTSDNTAKFAQAGGMTGGTTGGMTGGMALSETQIKILNLIKDNPKISFKKMEEILEINISALQKHIEKLKQQGIITREGAAFGGYWQIIK
jgi:ATP-dependent DNA helicase RecG